MNLTADPATDSNERDELDDAVHHSMTIDEVAQFAKIPVSTVRMYQNKGILPRPERRGRVGYYGEQHRQRLVLIAHLQTRGFSLAAIKESLDAWEVGQSLDHHLGVTDVAPLLVRQPLRLSMAELLARFEGVVLTQADIQRAALLGLVELDGAEVVVPVPAFVEIGPEIAQLGIPVGEILDQYELVKESIREIADRFRQLFERHLWSDVESVKSERGALDSVVTDASKLSSLATAVVTAELHEHFRRFADDYIHQLASSQPKN